jgi:hypothetical protein
MFFQFEKDFKYRKNIKNIKCRILILFSNINLMLII